MQDGIISTHVFYLPFSWELKNISGRQVLKGHKHKKTKDRIPLEGWKDSWPNDCMETDNLFTYKVYICWPELIVKLFIVTTIAKC